MASYVKLNLTEQRNSSGTGTKPSKIHPRSFRGAKNPHYGFRMPIIDRLFKYIDVTDDCWLWTGYIEKKGYGRTSHWVDGKCKGTRAHRVTYEVFVGEIPEGLQIDHLCRNRRCVNPDHLEPVTSKENNHRSPISISSLNRMKTHCLKGHEFTPENTKRVINGNRQCRTCGNLASKLAKRKRRAELKLAYNDGSRVITK